MPFLNLIQNDVYLFVSSSIIDKMIGIELGLLFYVMQQSFPRKCSLIKESQVTQRCPIINHHFTWCGPQAYTGRPSQRLSLTISRYVKLPILCSLSGIKLKGFGSSTLENTVKEKSESRYFFPIIWRIYARKLPTNHSKVFLYTVFFATYVAQQYVYVIAPNDFRTDLPHVMSMSGSVYGLFIVRLWSVYEMHS